MKAKLKKNKIVLEFEFDRELITAVKDMSGREWNNEKKIWKVFVTPTNIKSLIDLGFKMDPKIKKLIKKKVKPLVKKVPGLKMKPYKYQIKGIDFIERNKGRALIADDMGLGKTIQAIGWSQLHKKRRPVIIVCPSSLKLNWQREIIKWTKESSIEILTGKTPYEISSDFVIINYDILDAWKEDLYDYCPEIIIADEGHYIKSNTAKRTKAFRYICKGVPHLIVLTGTPIENRPVEIYNIIRLIHPDLFKNYMAFIKEYCGARLTPYGWDVSGATNTEKLHQILTETIMIRRRKHDVLKQLPKKSHTSIILEVDNEREYKRAENDIIQYLLEEKGKLKAQKASAAEVLVTIETLKQLAVKGKMKQVLEWIALFLSSGEKLILFTTHKEPIDIITRTFTSAVKIDGSVSMANRQKAVDAFQTDPKVNLIVGNIKAMGVGLTLTASSNVAFIELGWTSSIHLQAEDRAHRIGQKNHVNVYYLLAKGTIEEMIMEMLNKKAKIIDQIMDGKNIKDDSVFTKILKTLTK